MAKVLAIANGKGGVAKTTSAISLSAVLSERFQLLLVDADPQASASSWAERGEMPFDIATETDPALLVDLRQAEGYELVVVDTPPARESKVGCRWRSHRCWILDSRIVIVRYRKTRCISMSATTLR